MSDFAVRGAEVSDSAAQVALSELRYAAVSVVEAWVATAGSEGDQEMIDDAVEALTVYRDFRRNLLKGQDA
jgi:hypothetical protein